MLNQTVGPALGFIVLSFLTWSITFGILVFGVILRRKILLWDEHWKETVEESGVGIKEFAEDLESVFEKIRGTFRLLGFFLLMILVLMAFVVYLGFVDKPILGAPQVMNSLWLLSLVALSVVLPAFVNFGFGTYLAETMMLKANVFVFHDVREAVREKNAKIKMMEKAKQLKSQREAMKAANAQPNPEANNPAPAGK